MNACIEKVRDFHKKFSLPINAAYMTNRLLLFRTRLIVEEAAEFTKATSTHNKVEMADALGDLIYVTIGAAVSLGIDIEAVFNEIHKSNMSKSKQVELDGKIVKGGDWIPPDIEGVM